jgi:hypothetical protein
MRAGHISILADRSTLVRRAYRPIMNHVTLDPCHKADCTASIAAELMLDRPTKVRLFAINTSGLSKLVTEQFVPPSGSAWTHSAMSPFGPKTLRWQAYEYRERRWFTSTSKTPSI